MKENGNMDKYKGMYLKYLKIKKNGLTILK